MKRTCLCFILAWMLAQFPSLTMAQGNTWRDLMLPSTVCDQVPVILQVTSMEREFEIKINDGQNDDGIVLHNGPLQKAFSAFFLVESCAQFAKKEVQYRSLTKTHYLPNVEIDTHIIEVNRTFSTVFNTIQSLSRKWHYSDHETKRVLVSDAEAQLGTNDVPDSLIFPFRRVLCGAYVALNDIPNAEQCLSVLESMLSDESETFALEVLRSHFYANRAMHDETFQLASKLHQDYGEKIENEWPALGITLGGYQGIAKTMFALQDGQSSDKARSDALNNARNLIEAYVEQANEIGDYKLVASLLDMLTPYFLSNSLWSDAYILFDHALLFHEISGNDNGKSDTLNNYGLLKLSQGEILEAQQLLREGLTLIDPEEENAVTIALLHNLALTYYELGDSRISTHYFEQAVKISGKVNTNRRFFRVNRFFVRALIENKEFVRAEEILEQAIEYFDDGKSSELTLFRNERARLEIARGNYTLAENYLDLSITNETSVALNEDKVNALIIASEIALANKDLERFIALRPRIEELFNHHTAIPKLQLQYADLVLRFYSLQSNFTQFKREADKTFELIEKIQATLDVRYTGPMWAVQFDKYINRFVDLAFEFHLSDSAPNLVEYIFNTIERFQAVNHLHNSSYTRSSLIADSNQVSKSELETWLTSLVLDQNASLSQDTMLKGLLLQDSVSANNSLKMMQPHIKRQLSSLQSLQSKTNPNEAYLRYKVTEKFIYLFVIDNKRFSIERHNHTFNVPNHQFFAENENEFNRLFMSSMKELGVLIPTEYLSQNKISDLVVFPDGFLHTVPFSAINISGGERYSPAISQFELSYSFSVNDYVTSSMSEEDYDNHISIFADPSFRSQLHSEDVALDIEQGVKEQWRHSIMPLPWSRKEADAIKQKFPEMTVQVMLGDSASRDNLLSPTALNSQIIHIATHGYFSSNNPNLVGLLTAPSQQNAFGFVSLDDIAQYDINAQLIVISGCDTNMGEYHASEGINSLAKGLMASGAESVVGTLWKIPDRATSLFMSFFYDALKESQNTRTALAVAKRRMITSGRYRHPKYWAPFMLSVSGMDTQNLSFNTYVSPESNIH